jgi:hypothetical protein
MIMCQELVMRTEQIMERSGDINNWKGLSEKDNMEARFLMDTIMEYTERQSCVPKHINDKIISDEAIAKMSLYHQWFECIRN